jgi:ring-1,2-phenylacetyl-CoA epoxidase subunit PaaD
VSAVTSAQAGLEELRRSVHAVPDPELPVLTLGQLGVIRDVRVVDDPAGGPVVAVVVVTPTYSGCPAMEVIAQDVAAAVTALGFAPDVRLFLSPPWTTDWMSDDGRAALREAGIAPPGRVRTGPVPLALGAGRPQPAKQPSMHLTTQPVCPQCGAAEVEELARFGSTSCKSLWRCLACREPFDHFKPL